MTLVNVSKIVATLFLLVLSLSFPSRLSHASTTNYIAPASVLPVTTPLRLHVFPQAIRVEEGKAINLTVWLENVAHQDVYVDIRLGLYPASSNDGEVPLKTKVINAATGVEVHFNGPYYKRMPITEAPTYLHPHWFVGFSRDLTKKWKLPPGHYEVEMRYDTTGYGQAGLRNKQGWHGHTNLVKVQVEVFSSR